MYKKILIMLIIVLLIIVFILKINDNNKRISTFSYGNSVDVESYLNVDYAFERNLLKKYKDKNTPLHLATQANNIGVVNKILTISLYSKNLFDKVIMSTNKYGKTPCDIAKDDNNVRLIKLYKSIELIEQIEKTSINDKNIIEVIENEKLIINERLLSSGMTLLDYAVKNMRVNLVDYLLKKGANANNLSSKYYRHSGGTCTLDILSYNWSFLYQKEYTKEFINTARANQHEITKLLLENNAKVMYDKEFINKDMIKI